MNSAEIPGPLASALGLLWHLDVTTMAQISAGLLNRAAPKSAHCCCTFLSLLSATARRQLFREVMEQIADRTWQEPENPMPF